jgi:transcriptional regulator with XRE-family HTH domain
MATSIGERIMERRQHLGLTQEDLAFRMGYKTKSAINKIELGINDVSQSKVVRFAEALQTSVAYLMGWEEEKPTVKDDGLSEKQKAFIKKVMQMSDVELDKLDKILALVENTK